MSTMHAVLDRPDTASEPIRYTRTASSRLLVVDDQLEVVEAVRLLVTGADIDVVGAAFPAEALDLARAQTFDAAVIDLNYGTGRTNGEQGLELLSAFTARAPYMPVVVVTAWTSTAILAEASRRGARDVIEKPWDETRLSMVLRTQVQFGRALRRLAAFEGGTDADHGPGSHGDHAASLRLFEVEGALVRQAMKQHKGNVSRAARALGLSRSALYRRLERHKI